MDAATALDSLSTLLTSLSDAPYSLALHAQHIRLASQPIPELAGQLDSAVMLMQNFYSITEQVWLPLLREQIASFGIPDEIEVVDEPAPVDLRTISVDAVSDVIALFEKAEKDYLSIPILRKKIHFLTSLHAAYVASPSSSDFEPLLAENTVRTAIAAAVAKGSTHITQGHVLWESQVAWELYCLKASRPDSPERHHRVYREALREHIKTIHMERLAQIHSTHEQTLQSYSSFISEFYSSSEYEEHLVLASQSRAGPAKAWAKKERYELALENSPESYQAYISSEERVKSQDGSLVNTLYERAIAECASRRWDAHCNNLEAQETAATENALRRFWCDYIDAVRTSGEEQEVFHVIHRAIRSVPGSGEVWARYIRELERIEGSKDFEEINAPLRETIADAYKKALSTSLIQDVDQILPLVLAKAGYEHRNMTDGERNRTLVTTLEDGISMVRNAAKEGDPHMTLEKYLTGVYTDLEDVPTEQVLGLWQSTAKHYKNSYLAWCKYSELLIAEKQHIRARALFQDVSARSLDWPEAIWRAWIDFEHLHGSIDTIENCLEKVKGLTMKLERKRAREAAEMAAAQQAWMEASLAMAPPQEAQVSATESAADSMAVDGPGVSKQPDRKRKSDEMDGPEVSKRVRLDEKSNLKRDRENSTVFVSGLVADTTEDDLVHLFQDCGKIREIKLTVLPKSVVATVEFFDRTSVPAALTKDKKRVKEEEIAVHVAWQSTLYVTNFPEKTEDASIRELFEPYGEVFDVRWPSKKYKSTRRFCYVQYTSLSAAKSALALHERELEPGRNMTVYISNPERKQERTDAAANAREIYVAGLSKSVAEIDLRKLFEKFGSISAVRMPLDEKGKSRGFAFVEFETEASANAALASNNQELKKRRIAVTLADTRAQPRQHQLRSEGTSGGQARRSRTLHVKNVPPGMQEGLLQQALEKHGNVKRVEIFQSKNEAVVEMATVAEAGKLLLMSEPIKFDDRILELIEEDLPASARAPIKSGPMFVPRGAAGRPRAGIGSKKYTASQKASLDSSTSSSAGPGKGQDDFRRMLNPKT